MDNILLLLEKIISHVVLTVVTAKFNRQKYEKNKLGFEMALIFWHFLGALWIYLFFFIKYFG